MAIKVTLKHKDFGEIVIENVIEIHYCYPSPMGKRIAFESDIDGTGCTYDVADVIEFEAAEQCVEADEGDSPDEKEFTNPYLLTASEIDRTLALHRSR